VEVVVAVDAAGLQAQHEMAAQGAVAQLEVRSWFWPNLCPKQLTSLSARADREEMEALPVQAR
jgi:hypothetical protein